MDVLGDPIDRLNGQLNSALVQIGRTFRDANRQDAKGLGRARGQEQRIDVISKANNKFHEALDELEIEITQAKSVMERDLNRIRQTREANERAHDASKSSNLPSAGLQDALAGEMDISADAFADTSLLSQISGMNGTGASAEVTTMNGPSDASGAAATNGDSSKTNAADSGSTKPEDSAVQNPTASGDAAESNSAFDFDAIFGDAAGSSGFDLDFVGGSSAPNGGDATATAGASMDDLFSSADDFTNLDSAINGAANTDAQQHSDNADGGAGGAGTAEDFDALLPGLGSYVNVENGDLGGEDFSMIDMPAEGLDLGNVSGESANQNPQDGPKQDGGSGETAGAAAGDASGENTNSGGGLEDMDDIFGDMMDVGNMEGANMDDFDWGV